MPAKKPQPSSEESSSDDEEERARMAAIQSVAIESSAVVQSAATSKSKAQARRKGARAEADGSDASEDEQNGGLKHYQLKAQDALHNFLDTTFGSLISDAGGSAVSADSSSSDAEDKDGGATNEGASVKDTPGFQLFGRLPKRKAPTESEKRAAETSQRRQKRHEEGREFDEEAKEVRERLTSAAVEPDVISKAAATAAQRAAAEAKVDEARRQKEMTDEGQRIAKLKRERGVAQLIKGRIVMVKEPGIGEVRTKDGVGNGGGEAAEGVEGERKKKKKKKATLNEDLQEETGKTDTELKAVVGNVTDENGTVETPKKKKRKKKKADTTTTGG